MDFIKKKTEMCVAVIEDGKKNRSFVPLYSSVWLRMRPAEKEKILSSQSALIGFGGRSKKKVEITH